MMKLPPFITLWNSETAPSVPWKNGHGETKEIAIASPNASLAAHDFLWRLSQATISKPGDFSAFPGFDRLLGIVEGGTLALQYGSQRALLQKGDILQFSGDEAATATIPGGTVQDLGLLYRRGLVQAKMHEIPFLGKARSFMLKARTNFFFAAAGRFQASVYPEEWQFLLEELDACRIDRVSSSKELLVLLEPKESLSRIIAVEIDW